MKLLDKLVDFADDTAGLVIKHTQEIPDEHLSSLRLERADSMSTPAGEMHRVCSIPTSVVEDLKRSYGFDLMQCNDIHEILRMLRKHELDSFITSNKV